MRPPADRLATHIRRVIIEQSKRAGVGHVGSCLSVADLLAGLYGEVLRIDAADDPERDRFILSKGHAALALYAALNGIGSLDDAELETFCGDASALGTHPDHRLAGVDFSTGSLGHGLSIGVGAAFAARLQGSRRRVFVLISDAECNEGSVWEAVMFAAHHRISNLVVIVDLNAQQALGPTASILDLSPLDERWAAFGWNVFEVDGHDTREIVSTLGALESSTPGAPHVVLARTTFGKGVSFMESQLKWHYWPMDDDEYRRALLDIAKVAE